MYINRTARYSSQKSHGKSARVLEGACLLIEPGRRLPVNGTRLIVLKWDPNAAVGEGPR